MDELAGTTKSGLPLALYALALETFALGTTELVIVGLLPEVSGDRGDLVFAVASFSGSAAVVVEVVGALILCGIRVVGFCPFGGEDRLGPATRPRKLAGSCVLELIEEANIKLLLSRPDFGGTWSVCAAASSKE